MTRTFNDPFWKRLVTVDDEGIHEHRRGRPFAFIGWDDLDSLSSNGVCSGRGMRIAHIYKPREFIDFVSEAWRQRHPDRWQINRQRVKREADWAAFFWIPLFTLGPCLACYILSWSLGWPESMEKQHQKLHRMTAGSVIMIIGLWLWYVYRGRKAI